MELSPVGFDNVTFLPAAYLKLEINAASPVTPPADNKDEDLDGCDCQVEEATSDEDLPVAEGGVD